ncbi:DUF5605 domain-containing protein [Anaerobium acetethylicum]|uniref:DUF5060 domain-containing protein n=1 Tax=Anaerobium acetethylicum TaxID=1619234 RepID=A0A1D3TTW9_9FIRM|nr:DUF5605 domain-containing protein [Anaerobium acetethylicum]SCP97418.1 Protein of unknown function [Anaerobium acetethylicum]
MNECTYNKQVEKWDVFEASVKGHSAGNPFIDYTIEGIFKSKNELKKVDGFYDGDGIYKVRFMPSFEEEYQFEITGSFAEEPYRGSFEAVAPSEENHGPVRVANTYHFAYEDGTPYYSIGTTCYVWSLQSEQLQKQTLKTLEENTFNKMRFCIFPKHYDYNLNEPISYPYEGNPCDSSVLTKENFLEYMGSAPGNDWDFKRFNPKHFQMFEERVKDLMDLGIEADIIVMHPYDRWGFSEMDAECDDLYWNYVIARLSAYRNVWWSLANEYDLFPKKTTEDWERYASIICEKDAYNHLRSIHNCKPFYDYSRPWITHCSIQRQDIYKTGELVDEWRIRYKKPIIIDEIAYEGNIQHGWGNISGKEMVRRFWETTCRGGYAGHGETYMHPEDILWWSHGGQLHGDSPERFRFLLRIMKETPGMGLVPMKASWDEVASTVERTIPGESGYYLYYYGFNRPSFREYYFDDVHEYQAEIIDTWNMTIENAGIFKGRFKIELPGHEYMAVRIRKE